MGARHPWPSPTDVADVMALRLLPGDNWDAGTVTAGVRLDNRNGVVSFVFR